jgi:twitching motility protein PilI
MAKKKLDLQAYQKDILARLKSQAESGRSVSSSKLGVRIGGHDWLITLSDISEVLPVPDVLKVPLTHPWFLGMANVRGNLFGVTDLANYLGYPPISTTSESRVLLVHGKFAINAGLLVDRLVGLRNLEEMKIEPEVSEKPIWQMGRYKDNSGQVWDELNLDTLLGQNEFLQVAA